MTEQVRRTSWSTRGLERLAVNFVAQEHAGLLGSLFLRLARYLGGDPSQAINLPVAFGANVGLPDSTPAMSAVIHVTASSIFYRMDGGQVTANDPLLPVGTMLIITGQPSLKGFRATSGSLVTAVLAGSFYD